MVPPVKDIERSDDRLKGVMEPSPLVRSGYFTRVLVFEISLKLENLQETGAFKVRGPGQAGSQCL
jgi:threonine dehydratase